ncbi:hypothetical protein LguiA_004678 [Lonicera macranthoides]
MVASRFPLLRLSIILQFGIQFHQMPAFNVNCDGAFCPKSEGAAIGLLLEIQREFLSTIWGRKCVLPQLMSESLAISDACGNCSKI